MSVAAARLTAGPRVCSPTVSPARGREDGRSFGQKETLAARFTVLRRRNPIELQTAARALKLWFVLGRSDACSLIEMFKSDNILGLTARISVIIEQPQCERAVHLLNFTVVCAPLLLDCWVVI